MAGKKGRGGARPTPQELKELQGTARADRGPKNPVKFSGVPRPPAFLTTEAKVEWRRLAPQLERLGLLTTGDRATFALYCQAWADFRWSVDFLRNREKIVRSVKGLKQIHPALTYRRQSSELILRLAMEFGMTPAARAQVEAQILKTDAGGKVDGDGKKAKKGARSRGEKVVQITDRLGRQA
jgi:P27 family predicted phage terminase small subunit